MTASYLLGTGRLTWPASERRTDRYGVVFLLQYGDSNSALTPPIATITLPFVEELNQEFEVVALVIENRESTHIGDLAYGVFPRTPEVGAEIVLGKGRLSVDSKCFLQVTPKNPEKYPWLDMRALYDAHEQTVQLIARRPKSNNEVSQ